MGKPRRIGRFRGYTPNSQMDRRKGNRTFQHREYQKKVEKKKNTEYNATIDAAIRAMTLCPDWVETIAKACSDLVEAIRQILSNPEFITAYTDMVQKLSKKEVDGHGE